jgi:hypothetical protein
LANIVAARHSSGRFAGGLNRRQKQTHQDADDGNHHQQFHQRETTPPHTLNHRNLRETKKDDKNSCEEIKRVRITLRAF